MNNAGIYHRPESEFAFLYTKDLMRIRLQTARDDIKTVGLISGDFYTFAEEKWYQKQQPMNKAYTIIGRLKLPLPITVWPMLFVLQIFQVSGFFIRIKGFLTMKNNV